MMPEGMDLLAAAPWLLAAVLLPLLMHRRWPVRRFRPPHPDDGPLVSIVVPARNEAENISACVATLLNSTYPRYEVIVVDDESRDGTPDIVRLIGERSNGRLRLLEGRPLPAGWLGKSWACAQGAAESKGELLLFTDADTRHDDSLLGHAVGALDDLGAELVSVLPRQRMLTFWERVVLPIMFTTISTRYFDLERLSRTKKPRAVIANGQFMLFRRAAYERIGGHERVRHEIAEDLCLAQAVVAGGGRMALAHADDLMETRMYRSLGGIIEGWTKNLALGSANAVGPMLAPLAPWLIGLTLLAMWTVPPVVLVLSLFGVLGGGALGWSLAATVASLACWLIVNLELGVPPLATLFYPAGALVAALLFFRSALRGRRIEWRGRRYGPSATPRTPPSPGAG
ncbi:MAG TPA: glycosyltransferase family 2 protein [Longimicrobiales bacterium]|nr:glycosyltransferase family 2 protein [Longimicrobiales bacterium]